MEKKPSTSFRLSKENLGRLAELAKLYHLSKTATLEVVIYNEHGRLIPTKAPSTDMEERRAEIDAVYQRARAFRFGPDYQYHSASVEPSVSLSHSENYLQTPGRPPE